MLVSELTVEQFMILMFVTLLGFYLFISTFKITWRIAEKVGNWVDGYYAKKKRGAI